MVWPVLLDPSGIDGPTPSQARGSGWRRSSRGLYVPSSFERDVDQRIVEAAAVLPAYGGVTGWAALHWWGGRWFEGTARGGSTELPVMLALADRSIRPQAGVATDEERLSPRQLTVHRGLRLTTALYAVFFETRYAGHETRAVQVADMAAFSDLVSRDELLGFEAVTAGWTGMDLFRAAAFDMDENAWSLTEVTMRRLWQHEARLPRPLCNRPVFDLHGHHLGTPDLLDPVAGVLGEYNGAVHLDGSRRMVDVRREAVFRDAGLECVEMLAPDLADPTPFLARLRQAYSRAARLPVSDRRWTIQRPAWWIPTLTVEQRRALTTVQRTRLLAHRQAA